MKLENVKDVKTKDHKKLQIECWCWPCRRALKCNEQAAQFNHER